MEEQYGIIFFIRLFKKTQNRKLIKNDYKTKLVNYVKDLFLISTYAQIMIMPIIAYNYKTISCTYFITNILTSALIGFIIILGFFLSIISFINIDIAKIIGNLYSLSIDLLLIIAKYTSQIPLSKIYVKTPQIWQIILYYILIFLISYLYKKFGVKWIKVNTIKFLKKYYKKITTIMLIIIILLVSINIIIPNKLKIYFIDVNQGDSCLIITPNNTKILVDGGGSETYDIGENTLLPYLLNRGIKKIDYIMCSHFDTDHVGGIKTILANLKVKNLVISKQKEQTENFNEIIEIAVKKKVNIIVVEAGDKIQIDEGAYFDILYPTEKLKDDINENSIVAKFICRNISILFTRRYWSGSGKRNIKIIQ